MCDDPVTLVVAPGPPVTLVAGRAPVSLAVTPGPDVSLAAETEAVELTVAPAPAVLLRVAAGPPGPQGPQGPAGSVADLTGENKAGVTLAAGCAVAADGSGTGFTVSSSAPAGLPAVGLAVVAAAPTFAATVRAAGVLTLADWTAVAGAASLAPRATYFLGAAGGLVLVPDMTPGRTVQAIGTAVGPQDFLINVEIPIHC